MNEIGEKLSDKSLIVRKREVEEALLSENKKIVVFLDDIDRLNSDELYAIFRLIKLTGDFKNILYVLAFDDEIVAKMLSERYSGEGYSYLEKMIQLPLKIPKAQKFFLNKYFNDKIRLLFSNHDCLITEEDQYELQSRINHFILPFLDNPRMVVRIVNSLSFLLPMLKGEINLLDLVMIEWLKVKFPDIYFMIRGNKELFMTNFSDDVNDLIGFNSPNYDVQDFKDKLDPLLKDKSSVEAKQIKYLLSKLFPKVKKVLQTTFGHDTDVNLNYHLEKRICSQDYFERYFTYVVIEGQISDLEFQEFLSNLINENLTEKLIEFVDRTEKEELAFKLSIYVNQIQEEHLYPFCKSLASIAHMFPVDNSFFSFMGAFGTITNIVGETIKKVPDVGRLTSTVKLFKVAKQIEFAWELWFILHPKKSDKGIEHTFSDDEFNTLTDAIFQLTVKGKEFAKLVDKLDHRYIEQLLIIWARKNSDIITQSTEYIMRDNISPLKLVKIFSQWTSSTSHQKPYVSSLTFKGMENLCKVVDRDLLEKRLTEIYGTQAPPSHSNDRNPISDKELVGIFQQYCNNYRNNKINKEDNK